MSWTAPPPSSTWPGAQSTAAGLAEQLHGTLYRAARDHCHDELSGETGHGFSVDVALRWEAALIEFELPHTRRMALRTAMVFGVAAGGVMETTDRVVKLGAQRV